MHYENGKLKRNMIGMPKLGVGIKPYVWPYPIGKPSFAKNKFDLAGGWHKITNAVARQRKRSCPLMPHRVQKRLRVCPVVINKRECRPANRLSFP